MSYRKVPAELTPEQEALIPEFRKYWESVALRTGNDPGSDELGRATMRGIYERAGLVIPEIVTARGPLDVVDHYLRVATLADGGVDTTTGVPFDRMTAEQMYDLKVRILDSFWAFGQCDVYWCPPYRFILDHCGSECDKEDRQALEDAENLARACWSVYAWDKLCCVVQHPERIEMDAQGRLHSATAPAISWADGSALYYLCDINIPRELGEAMVAGTLTAEQVMGVDNAEVRRVLVDRFNDGDPGKLVRALGAEVVHSDVDPLGKTRRLLKLDIPGDEEYVVVEVTNSTPEPDGSYKLYTIRVAPTVTTCREAVARSFRMTAEAYSPVSES